MQQYKTQEIHFKAKNNFKFEYGPVFNCTLKQNSQRDNNNMIN